eukprot:m.144007 g.144007  ORF g.144007 m.144007 type:complete len:164 (-) comp14109_c0_seq8:2960-3451(-)
MLLYVMCAADKYEVTVDDECTVGDLQQVIAEQIDVPVDRQKLLFKGQNLHRTPEKPLKACKVKNKSKLMLIGVAEDPQTIECKQVFGEIAKSLEKYEATLAQVPEDIRGLVRSFQATQHGTAAVLPFIYVMSFIKHVILLHTLFCMPDQLRKQGVFLVLNHSS